MLRDPLIIRDWNHMKDCDRSYLRAAYSRYVNFANTSYLPCFHTDCFSQWLSKRGIRKSIQKEKMR